MNYRHAYHAGNVADVLKHTLLARVVEHLKKKPAPFRVIDTHAGPGTYDLTGTEAQKTGEWRHGIARLWDRSLPPAIAPIVAPYLNAVAAVNAGATLECYPGSPAIALSLMRHSDVLVANELHPEDFARLQQQFARNKQAKLLSLDAWTAVKSLLPPKERRGVLLIDPPFEKPREFSRLSQALADAARRFATGTMLLWYPIKDAGAVARFKREVGALRLGKLYEAELFVQSPSAAGELAGAGMLILNPPFTLPAELDVLMPFLAETLAQGSGAAARHGWMTPPPVTTS